MTEKTDQDIDTPPFFKSWRSIYLLVFASLILVILLLYLFSISYA